MLSKSSLNLEAWIFTLQKYTNLFLIGKNALIVMVSVLINIDVFEPAYNLKFKVQNHSYSCTNLISLLLPAKRRIQACSRREGS